MDRRANIWRTSAGNVSRHALNGYGGRILLLACLWLLCVPKLFAAQDDVSPVIKTPRLPDFEVIQIPPSQITAPVTVPVIVPDLLGRPWREAVNALNGAGLSTQEFPLFRKSTKPNNTVIDQNPAPGTKVKRGSSVTLTVSQQIEEIFVTVPDLRNLTAQTARDILSKQRLGTSSVYRESTSPNNTVIDQDPRPGTRVKPGTTVRLTLSQQQQEPPVTVPGVLRQFHDDAVAILISKGLTTQEFPQFRESYEPNNTVIDQEPKPGVRVKRGSSVRLTVSRQIIPKIELTASGPNRVSLGESARFSARLSRQIPGAKVLYRFYDGNTPITGWVKDPFVDHVFSEAGSTSVTAEARVELNGQTRQPRASISPVNVIPPPPPKVTISPDAERVEQGSTVSFRAQVQSKLPVNLVWDGPVGLKRGSDTYSVDTRSVSPGTHRITLTAYASGIEPVAAPPATLVIEEPYQPPRASIRNLTPRIAIGDPVELRGNYEVDPRRSPDLQWKGSWGTRDQVDVLTMDSEMLGLGHHQFDFTVRDGRQQATDSTTVEIYTPLDPPLARLDPPEAEVMQGDPVTFNDISPRENRGELVATWLLPDGARRGGSQLVLDTSALSVRTHDVGLQVDGPYGRSDTATAVLRVTPAYRPPQAAIDPAQGYRVEQGEAVIFTSVSTTDERFPITFDWTGSSGVVGTQERVQVDTANLEPGDYSISLTVSDTRSKDSTQVPLTVLAPPPKPELHIEPPSASVIRGDQADFMFAVTPADAIVSDMTWTGPQGETATGPHLVVSTRDLAPGHYDIQLTGHDHRKRTLSAAASLQVRDPVVALSVDRPELPPGESAVFKPRVTPEIPGAKLWLRIEGAGESQIIDASMPVSRSFPAIGTYTAVLVVERENLRWESTPILVVVELAFWWRALPWLGAAAGSALLIAAGTLGWRRFRNRSQKPLNEGSNFDARLRFDPKETSSLFKPQSTEFPGLDLALVIDQGTQVVMDTEEPDGQTGKPFDA